MSGLHITPVEESAEYRRFVRVRGLLQEHSRSPVFGILAHLDDLDRKIERAESRRAHAPSDLDVRRIDARIERLEQQQVHLIETLSDFPEEHVAAINELRLNDTNTRRST